jgi:hypothetical protein
MNEFVVDFLVPGCPLYLHIPGSANQVENYYKYVGEEFAKKKIPNMNPSWDKVGLKCRSMSGFGCWLTLSG